jgi:hypothetical protein
MQLYYALFVRNYKRNMPESIIFKGNNNDNNNCNRIKHTCSGFTKFTDPIGQSNPIDRSYKPRLIHESSDIMCFIIAI